jgi:hypothetical protein
VIASVSTIAPVPSSSSRPPDLDRALFDQLVIQHVPGELRQGDLGVGGSEAAGRNVPHRHVHLQRVDVDAVDRGVRRGPVAWW